MAMGLQDEQFAAGELARVLRTDDTTLQNWLRRSNLDLPAPIAGRRLFSAKFAFQLAILKELSLYGMGALQAGNVVKELLAQVPPDWLEQFVTGALDPDTVPLIITRGGLAFLRKTLNLAGLGISTQVRVNLVCRARQPRVCF
jgi:hypothetical protein